MKTRHHLGKKRLLLLITIPALLLLFTGCTQQKSTGSPNTISIENYSFNPNNLTVSPGTNVTWINNQNVAHRVVEQGLFDSGILQQGQSFTYRFTNVGTYDYICGIHTYMKGKIIVQ
jgi:plastocyanin